MIPLSVADLPTTMKAVIFLTILFFASAFAIEWKDNWAFACDFKENDLTNAKMQGSECGGACWNNEQCTHFTWTSYEGGTCWMKSGSVTKANAFDTGDNSMVCGVTRESS
jgi:hypothetical protein